MKQKEINSAVFYAKKHVNNSATLEYAVFLMPVRAEHRTAYSILAEGFGKSACIEAVTRDKNDAERIFNRLVCENITPSNLKAFIDRLTL